MILLGVGVVVVVGVVVGVATVFKEFLAVIHFHGDDFLYFFKDHFLQFYTFYHGLCHITKTLLKQVYEAPCQDIF